jgi:hypothetical protein
MYEIPKVVYNLGISYLLYNLRYLIHGI